MCRKHFSVLMFFGEFSKGLKVLPSNASFQTTIFKRPYVTSTHTSNLVPRFSLLENPGNEVVIHHGFT